MRSAETGGENYILFLQLDDQLLPECFYHFAETFSKWNIFLIPITPDELNLHGIGQKQSVISFIPDMNTLQNYLKIRKKNLDFSIISGRISLFEISSFGKISLGNRYSRRGLNSYNHLELPETISNLGKRIAISIYKEKRNVETWPGGHKAALPSK